MGERIPERIKTENWNNKKVTPHDVFLRVVSICMPIIVLGVGGIFGLTYHMNRQMGGLNADQLSLQRSLSSLQTSLSGYEPASEAKQQFNTILRTEKDQDAQIKSLEQGQQTLSQRVDQLQYRRPVK